MSLGQLYETIGRLGPRSRNIPVLVGTFLLSVILFVVLATGEAGAQPALVGPHASVIGGYTAATAGGANGPAVEIPPGEGPRVETPLAAAPSAPPARTPVDSAPPVNQPYVVEPLPETMPAAVPSSQPGSAPVLFGQYDPKAPLDTIPAPGISGHLGRDVPVSPVPSAPGVPQPVAFEKNAPLGTPLAGEGVPAGMPTTNARSTPLPENGLAGVGPVGLPSSAAIRAPGSGPAAPSLAAGSAGPSWSPSGLEASVNTAVGTLQGAATSATAGVWDTLTGGSYPEPSSAGTGGAPEEGSSEGAPQPSSPSVPPLGGSSFSLSGGGQASPGSVVPLLICVLASGLILLRRDGPLSWASCEQLPKPSSALLLPLERPG